MKIEHNAQCPKVLGNMERCNRRAMYPMDESGLWLTCWQHRTEWAKSVWRERAAAAVRGG